MKTSLLTTLAALATLAACADGTGPTTGAQVSLTFASGVTAGGGAAPSLFGPMAVPFTDGTNTLEITRVQIVFREIELKRVEIAECDVEPEPPECEDFEVGPVLVDLSLDGTTNTTVSVAISAGTYDEIEFDIHKVSDDPEDAAFLLANPGWEGKSIVVEGTYNSVAFTFETDLNEEQEIALVPNLVIGEDAPSTNVTIRLDVGTWFVDGNGDLFDPATALDGEPNENLAKDNIKASIDAFEDEDQDGDDTDES